MPVFKIWNRDRSDRKSCVAESLEQLKLIGITLLILTALNKSALLHIIQKFSMPLNLTLLVTYK